MKIKDFITKHKLLSSLVIIFMTFLFMALSVYLAIRLNNRIFNLIAIGILLTGIFIIIMIIISKDNKVIIVVSLIFFLILFLLGYIGISISKLFKEKEDVMIGFYGSIISGIISAIIGAGGAIYGAKIGGKSAKDAVTAQIKYQNDLINSERNSKEQLAIKIIVNFLWYEICYNCRMLDDKNKALSTDKFLKEKPESYVYAKNFKFNDYNKTKYQLLNYNNVIVKNVIEVYNKLSILSIHNDLSELTQREFNEVKTLYKVKDRIYNFIQRNN